MRSDETKEALERGAMTRNISFEMIGLADGDLHCARAGDPDKPLILFLHGFPEYWAAWRDVMLILADRFHVVAPDQRGFNRSFKPQSDDAYRSANLVADLAALADRFAPDRRFILAGHDWGAAVAYAFAFTRPERLSHLVIANGVHPACFQRAIFDDPEQRAASQYINKLRADGMEQRMAEDNYARTLNMIEGFSQAGWMTDEARNGYLDAWSQPGAMAAMLNWYRASPIIVPDIGAEAPPSKLLELPVEALSVKVPHLVVWGEADEALRPSCLDGLGAFAQHLTIRRVAGAGHWILHEKPVEVAKAIAEFVA